MTAGDLERGRRAYHERAWRDAYASLSSADAAEPLPAEDLELLATSAYMLGRDGDYLRALERAHQAHFDAGATSRAVRCAFWLGLNYGLRGESAQASGWLARAQRLLDAGERDVVERGYLLMPLAFQHEAAGEYEAAARLAGEAAAIAERFGDADGFALSILGQGQALIKAGRVEEGLALLDEAMVTVTTRELSPIAAGFVYCAVILACQEVYDVRRAREWTAALSGWCERQPDLVAFTGRCLVHRAEILQLRGDWRDALNEARRAGRRLADSLNRGAAAQAFYRQGELHRLRGESSAAERAYRETSRYGGEPQPGLALLRLAQGRTDAAAGAIRRALAETGDPLRRASLLAACVEILLAIGDEDGARAACGELEGIAARFGSELLAAVASNARGEVELVAGVEQEALASLRSALRRWQELDAPYEAARTRELVGLACRAVGDDDSGRLELEGAREVYATLAAAPDLRRVERLLGAAVQGAEAGLTRRERQVLALVASGRTNKAIAADLVISEKTVARHVSNIFAKLGLRTRAAATAYAYEHELV
jgi:DNA-binding CsgD family transcriptional regulator